MGRRERTWTGKKPPNSLPYSPFIVSYPAHPAPASRRVSAHGVHHSGSPDIFVFLCVHGLQDIQVSSVFITVSPLLPPRLRRGGWLFIRRHQPGYRCVQWYPSVTWCTHPARHPAVVFHVELRSSAASPFFIFSASRAAPDSPLHSGLR